MGLDQRQMLEQRQEQRLSTAQRQEMRQEMAAQMGGDLQGHFKEDSPDRPERSYDTVIVKLAALAIDEQTRKAIEDLMLDKHIKASMLDNPVVYASGNLRKIPEVIGKGIFAKFGGNFPIHDTDSATTTRAWFLDAIQNPVAVQDKIDSQERALSGDIGREIAGEGAARALNEMKNAITVVDQLRAHIETFRVIMEMLMQHSIDGEMILQQFFRDRLAFERFAPVVSERLQHRFTTRALQLTKNEGPKSLHYTTLNTVGEYTLLSLGVIAPALFVRMAGEVDEEAYQTAREVLQGEGVDLDEQMRRWKLHQEGTFFYHRYAIKSEKPTKITDELIRQFITETVRKDMQNVLDALEYDRSFFPRIKTSVHEEHDRSVAGRKNAHDDVREAMITAFGSQKFKDYLRKMIAGPWYEKLNIFMAKKE